MTDLAPISALYDRLESLHAKIRERLGRGLTLAEKILYAHLADPDGELPERGKTYADLQPDRVAMQDATAQMALLQFAMTGRSEAAVPSTVHCDHLIRARLGADKDLAVANDENAEVYAFLKSASAKYGLGFWEPGAGIIHQVVLENYAFPGGLMIGTDSHTPNAGGLGMLAIGVGGADAMEVMAGLPFGVRWPKLIGVKLTGKLDGWSSPKDVILKVCELLTVKGGTGAIVEYFGEGTQSISCTGKGTICNMGAEHGATTSTFPFDESMARYLEATGRKDVAELARKHAAALRADDDVDADPSKYFDQVLEIDLNTLPPMVVGPHTPDRARNLDALKDEAADEGWPAELKAALIGSCTNSSYEDMERAASVARQASAKGLKVRTPLMVTPGSTRVDETIRRDGQMQALQEINATVLANACGPCIGQWQRDDIKKGDVNSIITSFNRNFSGRNDGNHSTLAFISSPEVVVAMALAGRLDFDPRRDTLDTPDGPVKLDPPTGLELPQMGFAATDRGYVAPPSDPSSVDLDVTEGSKRLQLLEPFDAPRNEQFVDMPLLLKVEGKCTTDHISAAGPWLRFRGHLENISDNMYIGATNAFTGEQGKVTDALDGTPSLAIPDVARHYKAEGLNWVVVGDVNYGEGSSREHAAMSPRFLGCRAVVARSFARIAETNLKKQGVLALVFADQRDWDKIQEGDRFAIEGLDELAPGSTVTLQVTHAGGGSDTIPTTHTLSELQIAWFRAGSALNYLRNGEGVTA
ncbi:MAG: aconitate hydratase [Planctomycetota bacterium]|nr:MAG: aconitate hydratase [Planctomycetota bacterium]